MRRRHVSTSGNPRRDRLVPGELEILLLIAAGDSNREIARRPLLQEVSLGCLADLKAILQKWEGMFYKLLWLFFLHIQA